MMFTCDLTRLYAGQSKGKPKEGAPSCSAMPSVQNLKRACGLTYHMYQLLQKLSAVVYIVTYSPYMQQLKHSAEAAQQL